jgi:uncharacterized protein (DUF2336 family)
VNVATQVIDAPVAEPIEETAAPEDFMSQLMADFAAPTLNVEAQMDVAPDVEPSAAPVEMASVAQDSLSELLANFTAPKETPALVEAAAEAEVEAEAEAEVEAHAPFVHQIDEVEVPVALTQPIEVDVEAEVPADLNAQIEIPEEFALPQEPDPVPEKPKRSLLRKNKVDAFALVPDQLSPTVKPKLEVNTPEQDAESSELARSLLDMMAASSSGGQPQERALAADTLLRMLPRLPKRAKIILSQRLCMMEAPPPFLISKLINDPEQEVAGPLLEDCSHIPDEDLFQVIESGDAVKRRMMARRRKISRPIAESLAKTGDESVLLTLARNQGAEIPQEGFDAMASMVTDHPDLLAPLCTRQDLPVHFAFELFWLAPAQLRRYLLSRFLTDSELLTKILKITMDTNGDEQPPAVDHEAIKSALVESNSDRAEFFAAACKINIATVEKILADDQGEPLMAMIKVAGLPRSQLEEIIPSFNQGEHPLVDPERSLDELQAVFDQLSFNKARILLTYWDWATLRTGPYGALN